MNLAELTHPEASSHSFLYDSNWTRYCTRCPLRQINRGGWIGLTMGTPKEIEDMKKSPSSPKVKQPVTKRGTPIHAVNVPGYSRSTGTPGYVSKPANAAARKAK